MTTGTKKGPSTPEVDDLEQFKGTGVQAVQEYEESGGKRAWRSSSRWFNLPDGDTTVRFLPGLNGEPFFYETGNHYINGQTIFCRQFHTKEDKCPVCRFASSIWARALEEKDVAKVDRLKEQAKSLFARDLFLYNAIIRSKDGDKVVVLQTGKTVKSEVVRLFSNPEYRDVTHEVTGTDIVITRTGKKEATRYKTAPKRAQSYLAGSTDDKAGAVKLIKEILGQRKDLASLVDYPSEGAAEEAVEEYKRTFTAAPSAETKHAEETGEEVVTSPEERAAFAEQFEGIDEAIEKARESRTA